MGQNMGQSLTHVLTHNRIAYNGQVSIFQNTMSAKSKKPRNFQNFLKRKSYDLRVSQSMFKTSPMPITGTGRGFTCLFRFLSLRLLVQWITQFLNCMAFTRMFKKNEFKLNQTVTTIPRINC